MHTLKSILVDGGNPVHAQVHPPGAQGREYPLLEKMKIVKSSMIGMIPHWELSVPRRFAQRRVLPSAKTASNKMMSVLKLVMP